ncbi:hypothetical protein GGR52DRAFT_473570 [Hypoxylon sp. FL1284]|nr:hypothetical protein GGR52DRAFT_473570 [Hypoxylon sp. FL1284]
MTPSRFLVIFFCILPGVSGTSVAESVYLMTSSEAQQRNREKQAGRVSCALLRYGQYVLVRRQGNASMLAGIGPGGWDVCVRMGVWAYGIFDKLICDCDD